MALPLVSVVIASKNYARYLPIAIESVVAQTYTHWEAVVIDDGSIDQTASVVQPYLADKRIRYVQSDQLGQSRAKNLGVSLAKSDIISFLDADDIWDPTKLEKQVPLLKDDVQIVYSRRSLIDEEGQPKAATQFASCHRGKVLDDIFVQNFVCFSSVVVKKSVLDQIGRFDLSFDLAIDYDLWLRAARVCKFDFVDEPLVFYRTGHANLSRRLTDRVNTACLIMDRSTQRGGISETTAKQGYSSTCQTLAYVLRDSQPLESLRWLKRAWQHKYQRFATLKSAVAASLAFVKQKIHRRDVYENPF